MLNKTRCYLSWEKRHMKCFALGRMEMINVNSLNIVSAISRFFYVKPWLCKTSTEMCILCLFRKSKTMNKVYQCLEHFEMNRDLPTYENYFFRWFLKVLVSISSLMHSCSQVSILPGKDNDSRNITERLKLVFINCLCTKCIISFNLKKSLVQGFYVIYLFFFTIFDFNHTFFPMPVSAMYDIFSRNMFFCLGVLSSL